jgi:hypothetical protein
MEVGSATSMFAFEVVIEVTEGHGSLKADFRGTLTSRLCWKSRDFRTAQTPVPPSF